MDGALPLAVRSVLVVGLAVLATAAPGAAQYCQGHGSFDGSSLRLSAFATHSGLGTGVGGGIWEGGDSFYGGFRGGVTVLDETDFSSTVISVELAQQVTLDPERRSFLCPIVSASLGWGPDNLGDFKSRSGGFGIAVGGLALDTGGFGLVPNGSASVFYQATTLEDPIFGKTEDEGVHGTAQVGVGLLFTRVLSVQPAVVFPIDLAGAETTFLLEVSVMLGS